MLVIKGFTQSRGFACNVHIFILKKCSLKMITWFLFPNIFTQGKLFVLLGEAAYEKKTSFVTLGRSFYENEYLQKIEKI